MIFEEEVEQFGDNGGNGVANRAEALDIGSVNLCFMGDIQPGHQHRNTRLEDDFGRFRVDVNIKFRQQASSSPSPLRRP
ncbi:Uncharacterised protein [Salmonella enterica subsp. arizonae]|nr:Uncharacterised protein [Salmonella enterica subsp. arizonae]